jgi:SAM-dependent methyltransferase
MGKKEADCFRDYYKEAGLLRWWRRPFFRFHFCRTFTKSASFILDNGGKGTILDLGCGCGTQSIYLALKGARVIAIDLDKVALSALCQRKAFYEKLTGRKLDIEVHCEDVFKFDYASISPVAGIHSMFAFNLMQPSSGLIDRVMQHISTQARVAILDVNNRSWMARLLPWRRRAVWTPNEFRCELEQREYRVLTHEGGVVVPPLVWRVLPYQGLARVDRMLAGNWFWPISHLILGERFSR